MILAQLSVRSGNFKARAQRVSRVWPPCLRATYFHSIQGVMERVAAAKAHVVCLDATGPKPAAPDACLSCQHCVHDQARESHASGQLRGPIRGLESLDRQGNLSACCSASGWGSRAAWGQDRAPCEHVPGENGEAHQSRRKRRLHSGKGGGVRARDPHRTKELHRKDVQHKKIARLVPPPHRDRRGIRTRAQALVTAKGSDMA